MFQTNYFRIVVIEDETTVEVCGALKVGMSLLNDHHSDVLFKNKVYTSLSVSIEKIQNKTNRHELIL